MNPVRAKMLGNYCDKPGFIEEVDEAIAYLIRASARKADRKPYTKPDKVRKELGDLHDMFFGLSDEARQHFESALRLELGNDPGFQEAPIIERAATSLKDPMHAIEFTLRELYKAPDRKTDHVRRFLCRWIALLPDEYGIAPDYNESSNLIQIVEFVIAEAKLSYNTRRVVRDALKKH